MKHLLINLIALIVTIPVFAGDPVITNKIEKSAQQAVSMWQQQNKTGLKAAIEDLMVAESYLIAVSGPDLKDSYLSRIPKTVSHNYNSIGAFLWLIKQKKENNNSFFPKIFFKGKSFEIQYCIQCN